MLTDLMEALAAHWDDVLSHLDTSAQAALTGYVADFLASEDDEIRGDAARQVVFGIAPALPPDHPVRRALAAEGTKWAAGDAGWGTAARLLRARLDPAGLPSVIGASAGHEPTDNEPPGHEPTGHHGPEGPGSGSRRPNEIIRATRARILAHPALTEAQVRGRGIDPLAPGLIKLRGRRGEMILPAFQFGPDGHPYRVVKQVNQLLGAANDPWGVADWWLGRNGWIGAMPAESIGRIDDHILVAAARAVFEEA